MSATRSGDTHLSPWASAVSPVLALHDTRALRLEALVPKGVPKESALGH